MVICRNDSVLISAMVGLDFPWKEIDFYISCLKCRNVDRTIIVDLLEVAFDIGGISSPAWFFLGN